MNYPKLQTDLRSSNAKTHSFLLRPARNPPAHTRLATCQSISAGVLLLSSHPLPHPWCLSLLQANRFSGLEKPTLPRSRKGATFTPAGQTRNAMDETHRDALRTDPCLWAAFGVCWPQNWGGRTHTSYMSHMSYMWCSAGGKIGSRSSSPSPTLAKLRLHGMGLCSSGIWVTLALPPLSSV